MAYKILFFKSKIIAENSLPCLISEFDASELKPTNAVYQLHRPVQDCIACHEPIIYIGHVTRHSCDISAIKTS